MQQAERAACICFLLPPPHNAERRIMGGCQKKNDRSFLRTAAAAAAVKTLRRGLWHLRDVELVAANLDGNDVRVVGIPSLKFSHLYCSRV